MDSDTSPGSSLPPFPGALMQRYRVATGKLAKFQRTLFKRFAPNVAEVADEFNQLAAAFDEGFLPQYAALSWLGAAQCHKALGHTSAEVDRLLRSADCSIAAHAALRRQHLLGPDEAAHLETALRCYNQALEAFTDDSVFRAAILRRIKRIQAPGSSAHLTSSFASPSHRAHDLDTAADECVRTGDLTGALERRTELFDDICERRVERMYVDLLRSNELARVLLLLWLELPPARQSPSHVKLLQQFGADGDGGQTTGGRIAGLPVEMDLALGQLVRASCGGFPEAELERAVDRMLEFHSLRPEHRTVLRMLREKERGRGRGV